MEISDGELVWVWADKFGEAWAKDRFKKQWQQTKVWGQVVRQGARGVWVVRTACL